MHNTQDGPFRTPAGGWHRTGSSRLLPGVSGIIAIIIHESPLDTIRAAKAEGRAYVHGAQRL